jgi:hypothetical protein
MAYFRRVFRFREVERIEEFLSHILTNDEISILRSIAYFTLYMRILAHEQHSTILHIDWIDKTQIAAVRVIPLRKINDSSIMNGLVEAGLILERVHSEPQRFQLFTLISDHKTEFKLNTEIPIIHSYIRSFQDCFTFIEQARSLLQFLKGREVLDNWANDLLRCLEIEPLENWNFWFSRYFKSKDDYRYWLVKVLETSKVPTETVNSIIVGLESNYEPAKKEMRDILSKQGVSGVVIGWLITLLTGFDDK